MSYRALIETLVHFESFRNIGLTSSGLYYIRFQLYYNHQKEQINAHPIALYSRKDIAEHKKTKLDYCNIEPAKYNDESATFTSKVFAIRFCEEEVEINDFFQLRVELDVSDTYLGEIFYLDTELFYGENNILKELESDTAFKLKPEQLAKFHSVSKKRFII